MTSCPPARFIIPFIVETKTEKLGKRNLFLNKKFVSEQENFERFYLFQKLSRVLNVMNNDLDKLFNIMLSIRYLVRTNIAILNHFHSFKLSESGIYAIPHLPNRANSIEYILAMPISSSPEVFGLHENADITKNFNETSNVSFPSFSFSSFKLLRKLNTLLAPPRCSHDSNSISIIT